MLVWLDKYLDGLVVQNIYFQFAVGMLRVVAPRKTSSLIYLGFSADISSPSGTMFNDCCKL